MHVGQRRKTRRDEREFELFVIETKTRKKVMSDSVDLRSPPQTEFEVESQAHLTFDRIVSN